MKRFFCGLICLLLLLFSGCAAQDEAPTLPEDLTTVRLRAVGDIFLTDVMLSDARMPDGSYDFTDQFAAIVPTTGVADITIGNFEGNFTATSYSQENGSYPDALADTLAAAGFDLLQTANSFSIHSGISGMLRTRSVISDHGMQPLGTYESAQDRQKNQVCIREVNGIRIAFVAFTKGLGGLGLPESNASCVNLLYSDYTSNYEDIDTSGIVSVLDAAKAQDPDLIVAALHWGSENVSEISSSQESIANLLIRNGVDVILGSHSHRVGPVERRTVTMADDSEKEVVIAYGLGDFCAAGEGDCNLSLLVEVEVCKNRKTGKTTIGEIDHRAIAAVDRGEGASPRYAVLDADDAITLYESNYYDRVSQSIYERLLTKRERLKESAFPTEEE